MTAALDDARILFVGGHGHHSLRHLPAGAPASSRRWAFCPDPEDLEASRRWRSQLDAVDCPAQVEDFPDTEAALREFRPQVVSVGAVYATNSRHVRAALRAGVAVVSDKPIAASDEALAEIREACTETGARLITEFDFRARPEFIAARDTIRAGAIGTPCLLVVQKSYRWGTRPEWYADRARYGGTVLWIASHGLDAVRFLAGREVLRCRGVAGNLSRPEWPAMEDHTLSLLDLDGGAHAVVHADLLRPAAATSHGDDRARVVGTEGEIELVGGQGWITTGTAPRRELMAEPSMSLAQRLLYAALGTPDPDYCTEQSLRSARLMLACRRAQDEGRVVELDPGKPD